MRALVLTALLLLPLVGAQPAEGPRHDLIVTFREGAAVPSEGLPLALLPGFVLLDASGQEEARWLRDPRVERVDRAKPLEWHATPPLPSAASFGLTRVTDAEGTGAGVTVAVVDSGIDATHPDLLGRVRANVRLVDDAFVETPGDRDGHGTHVAGIVAASGASSEGRYRGVAPGAELVGLDISERFTTASAILAYEWLYAHREAFGLDVVVNAWGRVPDGSGYDARDPELRAIERLVASGVVVIFSASNRGPGPSTLSIEAMDPYVITVGSTDVAAQVMDYSGRGPALTGVVKPDLVAPGEAIVGLRSAQALPAADAPDLLHATYSGTSQAAPHVAGIVALMLEARPQLTPQQVADALRTSAIDLGALGPDDSSGYGLVDAVDAIRAARDLDPDRGNVLVAGGTDRYEDALEVPGTPRRTLFDLLGKPDVIWETAFPVKTGTERLRVDASAAGAQGLAVELVKDGRPVQGTELERPEPGVWTMRLRGTLPAASDARMSVESILPPQPERALAFDARQPPPIPRLADDPPADALDRAILLVLASALGGAIAGAALMPRRRGGE